jgi:hypothetical protein
MHMKWFRTFLLSIPVLLIIPIAPGEQKPSQEEVKSFPLTEISPFDLDIRDFKRGEYSKNEEKPDPEIKALPQFKSENPVYGKFEFGRIDLDNKNAISYHYALDESSGTGKGYDLLYFDLNRDLDLSNDQPLKPMLSPPRDAAFGGNYIEKEVFFKNITLSFDVGSGVKLERGFLPHLVVQKIQENRYTAFYLISTKLRTGKVEIAGQKFTAYLGHSYVVGPSFDWPGTALHLVPEGSQNGPRWWGADNIKAIHRIPDTPSGGYYRFSATPQGDQLFVRPYTGDFGIFEIGAGNRKIDKMEVSGSLYSKDANVAIGGEPEDWGGRKPAPSCSIPVGDYYPSYISVNYGKLRISISENYHSDGKSTDRQDRPYVYGMSIRKEKPYILDFSNKPAVMFASPPKDHRVKVGEKLRVEAVLTDPQLDIMIRGLDDTTRKKKTDYGYERDFSLDPTVVITRADGEIMAQGEMPFG